jgi:hypothetical protein
MMLKICREKKDVLFVHAGNDAKDIDFARISQMTLRIK